MKVKIRYHEINSDHILASPEFDREEIVECESFDDPKLISYIESKTDFWRHKFKKSKKRTMGFDYISKQGGVKVEEYIEPNIKTL